MSTAVTRSLTLSVAVAALACPLVAQRIVPIAGSFAEGNGYTQFPFVYDHFHFQIVLSGATFCTSSAMLTAAAFRRDAQINEIEPAKTVPQLDVQIAQAATTPASMSTTFAANVGGPTSMVFSGPFNLPMLMPAPPTGSGPFSIQIPFGAPFAYQLASGDLLLDLVGPGMATTRDEYFIDAAILSPEGRFKVHGQAGTFGSGESPTLDIDTFSNPLAQIVPGGTLVTQVYGMASPYPTIFAFGLSSTVASFGLLPFDCAAIGAPGNTFYSSLDAFSGVVIADGLVRHPRCPADRADPERPTARGRIAVPARPRPTIRARIRSASCCPAGWR